MTPKRCDQPVVLTEYDSASVPLTAEQERTLRHAARNRLTILPGDATNVWHVKSLNYVGTIVTPDVRVLIRPKIPMDSLVYLLEANGKPLDVGQGVFEYSETHDLVPAFATFYARHLERALAGGVARAYREFQDRLPGIRGRVDLPAQRRLAGLTFPAECRFDEYTADIQLNRILRGAADRLWRLPDVTVATRQALQRLAAELGECGQVRPEDLRARVGFTRLNEHCRSAERLARMVLADETLRDAAGASAAGVFLIDMNKVFEEFVTARLARYLAGRLIVKAQGTRHLDAGQHVRIRPDLIFERGPGEAVYVADTKYKITADGYGREPDYYQILAYATALGVPEGMLIYCQRDGIPPPRDVQVRTLGTHLRTWLVDLSGTPACVEEQLRRLADEVYTSATTYNA
jgi:5-methylcytosine-specific restriction enzyme subunit McrC